MPCNLGFWGVLLLGPRPPSAAGGSSLGARITTAKGTPSRATSSQARSTSHCGLEPWVWMLWWDTSLFRTHTQLQGWVADAPGIPRP